MSSCASLSICLSRSFSNLTVYQCNDMLHRSLLVRFPEAMLTNKHSECVIHETVHTIHTHHSFCPTFRPAMHFPPVIVVTHPPFLLGHQPARNRTRLRVERHIALNVSGKRGMMTSLRGRRRPQSTTHRLGTMERRTSPLPRRRRSPPGCHCRLPNQ